MTDLSPARIARRSLKYASVVADRLTPALEGPRLLIYHQVGAGNGQEMDLSLADFRRQMQWLASTGRVASFDDVLATPDDRSDRYVITFDDGYDDMYRNGFPILSELGLPFVLYLTSNPIETRVPLRDDGMSTPVSWDQVGEMLGSGLMTLGAHTHTHPDFRHISPAQIEDEIVGSNRMISERTGSTPRHFTYTWGYWTEQADRLVRAHYETATVAGCRSALGAPSNAIPRLPVQLSDGWTFFKPRVRGGFRLEDTLRRRLSGYTGP
jgi:peptidoglycan/xylan/chitin deacetylase (PgdA/CDA1 family)